MSDATARAAIQRGYSLTQAGASWLAAMHACDGSIWFAIIGHDRASVIRCARARWGHFNWQREAEAFAEIFPAQ